MAGFSLLILLLTTSTVPMPQVRGLTTVFPTKTADWELNDALAELRDPRSTPIERQVARDRLEKVGASALPALRRVAALDVSYEVRALAQSAIAYINGFPVEQKTAPEPQKGFLAFVNIPSLDDAVAQIKFLLDQVRYSLLEDALRRNIDFLERGAPGGRRQPPRPHPALRRSSASRAGSCAESSRRLRSRRGR